MADGLRSHPPGAFVAAFGRPLLLLLLVTHAVAITKAVPLLNAAQFVGIDETGAA